MQLKFILLTICICCLAKLNAQQAGTYDTSFSGDGKEMYLSDDQKDKPYTFYLNDTIFTFYETFIQDPVTLDATYQIELIKHTATGIFLAKNILFSRTAPDLDYYVLHLSDVKQTTNNKFLISYIKGYNEVEFSTNLALINADGSFDYSFGVNGSVQLDFVPSEFNAEYELLLDVYADNSILAARMTYIDTTTKIFCRKLTNLGTITDSFYVGMNDPNNYWLRDLKVNTDNSIFFAGATSDHFFDYSTSNFVIKLTPTFNYDTTFNNTGRLFIQKQNAGSGSNRYLGTLGNIRILNATTFEFFVYMQDIDTLSYQSNAYLQKYTMNGLFVNEKQIQFGGVQDTISEINSIKEDKLGRIYMLSSIYRNGGNETYLTSINPVDLTYNTSFNNGQFLIDYSINSVYRIGLGSFFIQPDNKIIVAGFGSGSPDPFNDFEYCQWLVLAKINNDTIPVTLIKTTLAPEDFLYPNPTNDIVYINFSKKENIESSVNIIDMTGRIIKHIPKYINSTPIDISDIPTGMYVVKTNNAIFKVVKN